MSRAVILSAVRTPIGRYGGALADVRPDDLAALAIAAAVERAGVPAEEIEDVWFGCANQAGEDNRNVARMAALLAGLPASVAGVTVNRLCASGLSAVVGACHSVVAGDGDRHEVDHLQDPVRVQEPGHEDVRFRPVELLVPGALDRRGDPEPPALLVVQDRTEHARGIEPREAEPVDRPVQPDQRGGPQVPDDAVVLDRRLSQSRAVALYMSLSGFGL